ncbi:MAG: hypothetical protein KGO49_03300 [Gammaproteobacteria bacterium]|nr:hypothetical protein [Gammaproteobacteria bacterium]
MVMKPRPSRITCCLCGYSTIFSPNSDRIAFNNNDEYKGKAFLDAKVFGMHTIQRNTNSSGFKESMEFKHENEKYISEFLNNHHIKHSGNFQNAISVSGDIQEKFNRNLGKTLAPYYRMVHSILKNQSMSKSPSIRYSNTKFFRAQLTESELIVIGLNILFNEEGRTGLVNYVKEFGLMKHLQAENVKKLVLMEFGPECFGRKASSLLPPMQKSQSF